MPAITLKTPSGGEAGSLELDRQVFGIEPNVPVMHQVVTAQLAARRSGTQSTKTRAEVRGGGAKPWRQKGTGRARQGSIRSPQWRGGGVALGPKPRSYAQRTPKKMVRLALRSALSDRAAEGKVIVVDSWAFEAPRTKDAIAALTALGIDGKALIVVAPEDRTTWLSFRNLPEVHVISPGELNAYDVLVNDWIVFSQGTLPVHTDGPNRAERRREEIAHQAADLVQQAKKARATAAVADHQPSTDSDEGEDDMDNELPNREKPTDTTRRIVDPKERVKSVADKADPRFEAARQKAEKEERIRAQIESQAQAAGDADDVDDAVETDGDDEAKPSGPFSFNVPKPEAEA